MSKCCEENVMSTADGAASLSSLKPVEVENRQIDIRVDGVWKTCEIERLGVGLYSLSLSTYYLVSSITTQEFRCIHLLTSTI